MSTIPTRTPQIPAIPKDVSHEIRRWMESVKEVIEVREGSRGQELDRGVTFRDLVDANIDISNLNINGAPVIMPGTDPDTPDTPDTPDNPDNPDNPNVPPWTPPPGTIDPLPYLPTPPQPKGLSATGGVGIVWLSWDNPQVIYRNHRLTEIWRARRYHNAPVPVLDDAEQIGTAPAGRFVDHIEDEGSDTYYYWIRFLSTETVPDSTEGIYGPWAGPVTGANVYEVLRDQILSSHLTAALHQQIYFYDPDDFPGGFKVTIENMDTETENRATYAAVQEVKFADITDVNENMSEFLHQIFGRDSIPTRGEMPVPIAGQITTVGTKANDNEALVQQTMASIGGIEALYTVKTQITTHGQTYVAGFGLISELKENGDVESQFIVDVNTFAVIDSSRYQDSHDPVDIQTPFMIGDVGGVKTVVIKNAAIGDATITSAKIDSLSASKIDTGHINVNTSITLGGDVDNPGKHRYMEINSFEDANGNNNAHMVFYDNGPAGGGNARPRVQIGRSTDSYYGYNGFGIQVWDEDGNPVFDANGSRLLVGDAFINNLWAGGFKVTVPAGNTVQGKLSLPNPYYYYSDYSSADSRIVTSVDFDPQNSSMYPESNIDNLIVTFDLSFLFSGSFKGMNYGGDIVPGYDEWIVDLYAPNRDNDFGYTCSGKRHLSSYAICTVDNKPDDSRLYSECGTCNGSFQITGDQARYAGKYILIWTWLSDTYQPNTGEFSRRVVGYNDIGLYNRSITVTGLR